jgi:iron-sulfur cluster repair protein YtfE (RIC family)
VRTHVCDEDEIVFPNLIRSNKTRSRDQFASLIGRQDEAERNKIRRKTNLSREKTLPTDNKLLAKLGSNSPQLLYWLIYVR